MYNKCNCPVSYFTAKQQPPDLVTKTVSGPADITTLTYQENYIEGIYKQNCGTYTVTLSPAYSFLSLTKTGATGGPNNQPYWDRITLQSNDPIDIGQYEVLMTVSQNAAVGDGYNQPYVGAMPSISYKFKATINPCTATYAAVTKTTKITYTIGASALTTGTYLFQQTPNCAYIDFVQFTPALPYYVKHNSATKDFTVMETENRDLAGTTTYTFKGYVLEPNDYTMAVYTERQETYTFDIEMIDPCKATVIDAMTVNDMRAAVFGNADIQSLSSSLDSVAKLYGDKSGQTYCGQKSITVISASPSLPAHTEFLTIDYTNLVPKLTVQSSDPTHQGSYDITIEIKMKEAALSSIKQTVTFKVVIDAC